MHLTYILSIHRQYRICCEIFFFVNSPFERGHEGGKISKLGAIFFRLPLVTVLVQSSSVFTSTLTPLAGAGLVTLGRTILSGIISCRLTKLNFVLSFNEKAQCFMRKTSHLVYNIDEKTRFQMITKYCSFPKTRLEISSSIRTSLPDDIGLQHRHNHNLATRSNGRQWKQKTSCKF